MNDEFHFVDSVPYHKSVILFSSNKLAKVETVDYPLSRNEIVEMVLSGIFVSMMC